LAALKAAKALNSRGKGTTAFREPCTPDHFLAQVLDSSESDPSLNDPSSRIAAGVVCVAQRSNFQCRGANVQTSGQFAILSFRPPREALPQGQRFAANHIPTDSFFLK
jgi:hypothetical protein